MITRISTVSMQNNLINQLANNQNKFYELQNQALTGNKLNSIIDNPTDAAKIIILNNGLSKLESYQKNVSAAQSEYEIMDSTLANVVDRLQRANELANSASNEYNTPENLQAIKNEITSIKDTILSLSNTQYMDMYIFSGTNTNTNAFTLNDDGSVVYNGTPQTGAYQRQLEVAEDTFLTLNAAGDALFGSYDAATQTGDGIFKTLIELEAALDKAGSTDATESSEGFTKIRESINLVQDGIDNVTGIRSRYGTYAQKADMSENSLTENSILMKDDLSAIQDVDLVEVYSGLISQQYALQASMQVGAMTLQQSSLLNYI